MKQLAAVLLIIMLISAPALATALTGTQSLAVEYGMGQLAAMGTLVLDLALVPEWHVTYIHDRQWQREGRAQIHDISVTRALPKQNTITMGWRTKVPDRERIGYAMWAWRWGSH